MEYVNYCKVCEYYDSKHHCKKGWRLNQNIYCNGDNFKPSYKTTILNFILDLMENGDIEYNYANELLEKGKIFKKEE